MAGASRARVGASSCPSTRPIRATSPAPRQYALVLSGEVAADGQRLRPMGLMYSEAVAERSEVGTVDVGAMIALMTFPAA